MRRLLALSLLTATGLLAQAQDRTGAVLVLTASTRDYLFGAGGTLAKLIDEAPDLASPFLMAVCKTFSARIRADNKRYRDTLNFNTASGGITG